jgi:hypothetical protein
MTIHQTYKSIFLVGPRAVSTWTLIIPCWILDLFLFIIYFALSGLQYYHSHLTWGGAPGYYIFPLRGMHFSPRRDDEFN